MSRTGSAAKLLAHRSEPYLEIHPEDAAAAGLVEGQLAEVRAGQQCFVGRVQISTGQRRGELFAPIHWNHKFAASAKVGALIAAELDPVSGQPEFKQAPVWLRPLPVAWQAVLFTQQDLRPPFDYFAKVPVPGGWQFRLAHGRGVDWAAWLAAELGAAPALHLQDSAGGFYHAAVAVAGQVVALLYVGSRPPAVDAAFAAERLGQPLADQPGYALLAGASGAAVEDPGRLICSCFAVGEVAIRRAMAAGAHTPEALGRALRCGTNCGSCVPELQSLLRQMQPEASL